jgi:hypothetical protein
VFERARRMVDGDDPSLPPHLAQYDVRMAAVEKGA